jgi:uncharacterized repeat protein (TIGR01451 family)
LALGESRETQFSVRVSDPVPPGADAVVNQARLFSQQGFSTTQTLRNDIHAGAELVVAKSNGTATVEPGSWYTYTLTLSNTGNRGSTGIVLTDTLPQYTTYIPGSASDGGHYDPLLHQVVWPLTALLPGKQSVTRTLSVLVQDPLPLQALYLTNTLQVSDDRANRDTVAGNLALDVDTVERHPSLRIIKRGPDTADVGEGIVYTLTVATVSYTPTGLSAARVGDGSPIKEIEIVDSLAHPLHFVGGDDGDQVLEFTETWVYTASYVVMLHDRGALVNVATAQGVDINGDLVSARGSFTTRVPGQLLLLPIVLCAP